MSRTHAASSRSKAGFSLVEVAMALGIVSFGMISMIGLLPTGFANFRQAMNNTVESQIVQGIASQLKLTDSANLAKVADGKTQYYYDAEGNQAKTADQALYSVTLSLGTVSAGSFPVDLTDTAKNLAIAITNTTQPGRPHRYSMLVASQNVAQQQTN